MADKQNKSYIGFLLGAALGAGAVYLFGTKHGRKTLEGTAKRLESYEGVLEKKLKQATTNVINMSKPIQKKAQDLTEKVKETIEEITAPSEDMVD